MFTAQDIIVAEDNLLRRTNHALSTAKNNGVLTNYRSSFQIEASNDVLHWGNGANAAKYVLAFARHREYVMQQTPSCLLGILLQDSHPDNWYSYEIHHFFGGLKSSLKANHFTENDEVYVRVTEEFNDYLGAMYTSIQQSYGFALALKADESDDSTPILVRAYAQARRGLVSNHNLEIPYGGVQLYRAENIAGRVGKSVDSLDRTALYMEYNQTLRVMRHKYGMERLKPTAQHVLAARNEIAHQLRMTANSVDEQRRKLSQENFKNYWNSMKAHAKTFVHQPEVMTSFNTIPILPVGTESSRRWGIEIEVVQAQLTTRPRGWEATGDGSLEPVSNSNCNCGCDDCEDYDSHCGYDDCSSECVEYVSPILSSFNSAGVKQLSDQLRGSEVNDSAGVHIHCDAADLSIADVARLCVAYSAVSPFIWEVTDRNRHNYCRDITSENLAYWLGMWRKYRKGGGLGNAVTMSREMMPTSAVQYQPDDRYRDLNLQALQAHGTIEFRAMGPVYDYERLIRWAWMCRELVNVSKLDLPQSTWTSIRSMADVVRVLQTYGSEQLPEGITKLFESGDSLQIEEEDEASND